MSDQKKWFKVWSSIIHDPHHSNLSLEDVGRWTRLGAYIVSVGTNGRLLIDPPAKVFLSAMGANTIDEAKCALKRLPNVQIEECKSDNGSFTVIMLNWFKYQVDSTGYERLKRSRYKRRGEYERGGISKIAKFAQEREKEEKERTKEKEVKEKEVEQTPFFGTFFKSQMLSTCVSDSKQMPEDVRLIGSLKGIPVGEPANNCKQLRTSAHKFEQFWASYPKRKNKGQAEKAWEALKPTDELLVVILKAVEIAKTSEDWRKDGGQFIPYPATWLRAKGWEDDLSVSNGSIKLHTDRPGIPWEPTGKYAGDAQVVESKK